MQVDWSSAQLTASEGGWNYLFILRPARVEPMPFGFALMLEAKFEQEVRDGFFAQGAPSFANDSSVAVHVCGDVVELRVRCSPKDFDVLMSPAERPLFIDCVELCFRRAARASDPSSQNELMTMYEARLKTAERSAGDDSFRPASKTKE